MAKLTVLEGRAPTEEEEFYSAWSWQHVRESYTYLDQVLRQILTLVMALMGGSVVFLDKAALSPWGKWTSMGWLLAAFILCLLGILPVTKKFPAGQVDTFREEIEAAKLRKARLAWAAGTCIAAAFVTAIVALG